MTYNVFGGTLNLAQLINILRMKHCAELVETVLIHIKNYTVLKIIVSHTADSWTLVKRTITGTVQSSVLT